MKPHRRVALTAAAAVWLVLVWAAPAIAAPTYVSSDPADGERVHKAPEEVSVTFSEPLDPSSTLEVRDGCGRRADDKDVRVDGNTMTVGMAVSYSGGYTVLYEAVGVAGVTGTTEDDFNFSVHFGKACDGSTGRHGGHGGDSGHHEGGGHGDATGHGAGHETGGDHAGTEGHDEQAAGHGTHPGTTGTGGHRADHENHDGMNRDDADADPDAVAAGAQGGEGAPATTAAPDRDGPASSSAAVAALGLAALVGLVGGWVLRVSAPS